MTAFNHLRLWWRMADKAWLILRLVFILAGAVLVANTEDNVTFIASTWVIMTILMQNTAPDVSAYRAAGLGSREWQLHRRISVAVVFVVAAIAMVCLQQWLGIVFLIAYFAYLMLCPPEMPAVGTDERLHSLVSSSPGRTSDGHFAPTVPGQLIYRPLVAFWVSVLILFVLAGLILWAVLAIWPGATAVVPVVGVLVAMTLPIGASLHMDSLRECVVMGYSRKKWGFQAGIASLAFVVPATVVAVVVTLSLAVPMLPVLVLALPPLTWAITFLCRGVWPYAVAFIAVSLAAVYFSFAIELGTWLPIVAAFLVFTGWFSVLPMLARKTNVQGESLYQWLGMDKRQNAYV